VTSSHFKTNNTDKASKIYLSQSTEIDYGIITITPVITGDFQRYRVDNVKLSSTEKTVTGAKMTSTTIYAGYTYGLSLLVYNNKCSEHGVTCITKNRGSKVVENKDGITNKSISFKPNEIKITINASNGKKLTIPLSRQGIATANLRELDFPNKITVISRYKGITDEKIYTINPTLLRLSKGQTNTLSLTNKVKNNNTLKGRSDKNNQPFQSIKTLINDNMGRYLQSVSTPYIASAPTLALVEKPVLPISPELIKSQFETKQEFKQRVQTAINKREKIIGKIQKKYSLAVKNRNHKLKVLMANHHAQTKQVIEQFNQRQLQLKENIKLEQSYQLKLALNEVYVEPNIDNFQYDAETQTAYAELTMTGAKFKQTIQWKVSPKDAKQFYSNPELANISAYFKLGSSTKNSRSINLSKVYLSLNNTNKSFAIAFDKSNYQAKDIRVVLNNKIPQWRAEQQSISADLNQTLAIANKSKHWQNSSLVDNLKVSAITYVNQQEAHIGSQAFNDDIPSLLAKSKKTKINNHKWLIVIGIENYQFTDKVSFAKRSAELFVKVAQKKLGIKSKNTLSLIDHHASSGAIKDSLKLFLANIPKNDQLYFYYSGHGIPDPQNNNEPYILPIDKIPGYVANDKSLKLSNIYLQLSQSKAKKIVAWVDSCFSGATDGKSVLKGVASARLVPKKIDFDKKKMAVITAGRNNQFSNMYKERGNRLFSYFVMKALLEERFNINTLYQRVAVSVKDQSKDLGLLYIQEPLITGNIKIQL